MAWQYHLPPEQKQGLENNIQNLIDLGMNKTGESDWKCSLFVVPQKVNDAQKKETSWVHVWRVVHDEKPLNMHVKTEEDTLPRIPDIYATASNKTVFSLIDLKKAFFYCDVAPSSRHFFGIPHASKRLYMRKIPMGFKNSPAVWQRIMNHDVFDPVRHEMSKLCGLPLQQTTTMITAHIDDIFIATYTIEQHLMLLEILFETLAHLRITVNIKILHRKTLCTSSWLYH